MPAKRTERLGNLHFEVPITNVGLSGWKKAIIAELESLTDWKAL